MVDEITINDVSPDVPRFRITEEGDQTIIRDYATGAPRFRINGKIAGGGVEVMTTEERTAITPEAGQLIYDTDFGVLYVGDGVTPGGIPVGSGGGGEGGTPATVKDIMTGSGASKILNVTNIRGALTAGQAVDVTSQPDGVTGDYKGTFTVTGTLGFASFPKYASGLNYLFIADFTATTSGTVTPSGTWLDGTTTAKSLAAGTSTRVAMLFNAANKAKFTFASTGSVSVTNCREYEVTACSNEAIAYIAALSNPDAFASYYLVKADMVQPWTYIIDMGTSPAVTVAAGLSYKLNASIGTHTLTADTCPAGYDGRDAIIRITLGGSGVIQAVSPLQLGGALVPYAINNCVVKFRDGEAVLLVEDTLAGYVVTVTSGTDNGSLAYGLAATGIPYIAFSTGTDGSVVDMGNVVTANEEVTVVGNGYTNTAITGNITCTNKTTVANLSLQDVNVMGGVMILGDAFIPSGSTVAVSGGGLAIEKVTGNGGVIDLGGTTLANNNMTARGCAFVNGSAATGGTVRVSNRTVLFSGCTFSGNRADSRGGAVHVVSGGTATFSSCTFSGNYASQYGGALFNAATVNLVDCIITGNEAAGAGGGIQVSTLQDFVLTGCTVSGNTSPVGKDLYFNGQTVTLSNCNVGETKMGNGGVLELAGSNTLDTVAPQSTTAYGSVVISSGAVLDLTGNTNATPIAPGGGITFEAGGVTVLYGSTENPSSCTIGGATVTPYLGNDGSLVSDSTHYYLFGSATVSNLTLKGTRGFFVRGNYTFVNCVGSQTIGVSAGFSAKISGTYSAIVQTGANGEGTLEFADGAVVTMTNASVNTAIAQNVGTVIVGTGCTINGNPITPGTYTSATIKKDGTITEA